MTSKSCIYSLKHVLFSNFFLHWNDNQMYIYYRTSRASQLIVLLCSLKEIDKSLATQNTFVFYTFSYTHTDTDNTHTHIHRKPEYSNPPLCLCRRGLINTYYTCTSCIFSCFKFGHFTCSKQESH